MCVGVGVFLFWQILSSISLYVWFLVGFDLSYYNIICIYIYIYCIYIYIYMHICIIYIYIYIIYYIYILYKYIYMQQIYYVLKKYVWCLMRDTYSILGLIKHAHDMINLLCYKHWTGKFYKHWTGKWKDILYIYLWHTKCSNLAE